MRVAIIHPDLGIGGAERLIVDAAVELSAVGHHVHVFTSHHDKSHCFEETLTGSFTVSVYGSFLPRHVFYHCHALFAYMRCLWVAIRVLFLWPSFDVVLVDQVSIVIPLLRLKSSQKVMFYCHFPDLLLAKHTSFVRRLYRKPIDFIEERTTGMADVILVNSKYTASVFARTFKGLSIRGVEPAVLYPAVNVSQFADLHCSFEFNFLSVNRFERKKNIELSILAFGMLKKELEGDGAYDLLRLTIAGGYDERITENVEYLMELKELAQIEDVSNSVTFITSCSTSQRNHLLSQCLCVLYTPTDEHFGIVPLEAMAAGKPVVACNSGGPVETIVDKETGFLCEPTPSNFVSVMRMLVQNPKLAESMGRAARQHVTRSFSTDMFRHRLNRCLLDLVVCAPSS